MRIAEAAGARLAVRQMNRLILPAAAALPPDERPRPNGAGQPGVWQQETT
ncbi:MAG TPA: hypothetical protein VK421_00800 [Pyrinomonadaceae bacterium]|nr:hypothetical protein [Pyrinomonadaceae bacterium]